MNKHANIQTFTLIGIMANICFVLFIFLGFLYYWIWSSFGTRSTVADIGIYPFEILGFILLAVYTAAYVISLYGHRLLKFMMILYFVLELVLILFDMKVIFPNSSYNNGSWWLISFNLAVTILACISYRTLAPLNMRFTRSVLIAALIIPLSFGILGILFSFKVYFTILANSIAYLYLNTYMYLQMNNGNLEIETRKLFDDI